MKDIFQIDLSKLTVSQDNKNRANTLLSFCLVQAKHMYKTNKDVSVSDISNIVKKQLDTFYSNNPEYTTIDIRKSFDSEFNSYIVNSKNYLKEMQEVFNTKTDTNTLAVLDTTSELLCNNYMKELTPMLNNVGFNTSVLSLKLN